MKVIYDSPLTTSFGTIISATPEFGRGLSVANGTGTTGTLEVVNGTINVYQAALIDAAIVGAPLNGGATSKGYLTLNGGNVTVIATNYGVLSFPFRGNSNSLGMVTVQNGSTLKVDRLRFGGTGAFNDIGTNLPGVLNLNTGGIVHIRNIVNTRPEHLRATNNFDGGTIKVLAAETFAEGKNPLIGSNIVNKVLAGGLVVDTAGFDARILSPLLNGVAGTDGGITKIGNGTLSLRGVGSTYTGPTTVSNGVLAMQVPMTSTVIRILPGATNNFITDNTAPWALPSLGLTNVTVGFDYGNFAGYTNAVVAVNNLHVEGTIFVNILGTSLPVTNLTLLTYTSPKTGGGSFTLGTLPLGMVATLTDTGSSLELNVTSPSVQSLVWTASYNANWATNELANWNSATATYLEYSGGAGDLVTFDDSTGTTTVNLPSTVKPASITVNNTVSPYTFTGPGKISGATDLEKLGANTLQIDTTNDFTGEVTVNLGTVIVNNATALGATNSGTIVYGPLNTLEVGAYGGAGVTVVGETVTINGTGVGGSQGALRGGSTISGSNVWAGPVRIGDGSARIGTVDGGNLTVSGQITELGVDLPLVFRPGLNSTMMVSGTSNYWGGNTTIFGSDSTSLMLLGANNAFPTNTLLLVGGNATLDLNGYNQTSAGLGLATGGNTLPPLVKNTGAAATLTLKPNGNVNFTGDISDNIAITIQGTNTQTLSGGNLPYTGATTVNGGRLNLTSIGAMASSVTVNAGGALGGEATTTGSLTLNPNSILYVDPSTPGSFTANAITASGGPIVVNFTGAPSTTEPTVLLTATTTITANTGDFVAPSIRGGSFAITNGNQLIYVPGTTTISLTWKGGDALNPTFWDLITTTNWLKGTTPDKFYVGDKVSFDDSGATNAVVIQGGSVTPGMVTFDNSTLPYTVSGGAIAGTASLVKQGSTNVTLSTANSYSGTTTISAGTLIAQNGAALGSVASGTYVTNSGTLDVGGMNLGAEVITISGGGVGGNGAVVNSGADQINAVQQMVLAGNATVGGINRWDLRGTGNALDMAGFTLTKTGTNLVGLVLTTVNNAGNIIVAQGTLGLHLNTTLGGSSANTMTIHSNATVNFYQSPTAPVWSLVMNDGATYYAEAGSAGQNNWAGPVSILGVTTLRANVPLSILGNISGAGSILKIGGSTATLAGTNNYAGNTTVNQGRLVIQQATLATNSTITVTNGAVLELGFAETNTVAALVLGGVTKSFGVYNSTTDPTFLAGAGSLRVSAPLSPTLVFTSTGSSLQFSWTGSFRLQSQTNSLSTGLGTNWFDYPGGGTSPVTVPVDAAQPSVFFRLIAP